MDLTEALAYADLLGCRVEKNLNDAGLRVHVEHDSGAHFTGMFYWGDEERHTPIVRALVRHLNSLPWPSENDPRTNSEGVYA